MRIFFSGRILLVVIASIYAVIKFLYHATNTICMKNYQKRIKVESLTFLTNYLSVLSIVLVHDSMSAVIKLIGFLFYDFDHEISSQLGIMPSIYCSCCLSVCALSLSLCRRCSWCPNIKLIHPENARTVIQFSFSSRLKQHIISVISSFMVKFVFVYCLLFDAKQPFPWDFSPVEN